MSIKFNKYKILFFIFLSLFPKAKAQIFPYRQLTTLNGLCNSNVYDIKQDNKGYIWIATDNGLSKYDGVHFRNYFQEDGLADNSTTGLMIKDDSTLYIGTFKKGLSVLTNEKFKNYIFDDKEGYVYDQIIARGDILYIGRSRKYLKVLSKGKTISTIPQNEKETKDERLWINRICQAKDSTVIVASESGLFCMDGRTLKRLEGDSVFYQAIHELFKDRNGDVWFSSLNKVYRLNKNKNKAELKYTVASDGPILRFVVDFYGNLWYYLYGTSLKVMTENNVLLPSTHTPLKACNIQCLFLDKEGTVWVGTNGRGIFCFYNLYIKNYNEVDNLSNNNITKIIKDNVENNIIVCTQNKINLIRDGIVKEIGSDFDLQSTEDIEYLKDNSYCAMVSLRSNTKIHKNTMNGINIYLHLGKSISRLKDGSLLYYKSETTNVLSRIILKDNSILIKDYIKIKGLNRLRKVFVDSKERIWVCAEEGVYIVDKNLKVTGPIKNKITIDRIRDIKERVNGDVWLCSQSGIAIFNKNNKWKILERYKNVELKNIRSIAFDNNNRIWLGTLSGILYIDNYEIFNINYSDGLVADEITYLYYDKSENNLWVGTANGLSEISLNGHDNMIHINPTVEISNIYYGNKPILQSNIINLPSNNLPLKVQYFSVNFLSPDKNKIRYRIDNFNWIESKGTSVEFASFPFGTHTLEVKIGSNKLGWSKSSITTFNKETPFIKSTVFIVMVSIASIMMIALLMFLRIRYLKKRSNEKFEFEMRISELKHQAFGASMNPHFIFNSLNSVQYFISNNKNEDANNYLVKLSRLIRINLDGINKSHISIAEEIEKLNYYFSLEKMRFGEKINFELKLDSNINQFETKIPNMIIQPFVENSLWHGLLSSTRPNGLVKVGFEKHDDYIYITIEDNGIGISSIKKNKTSGHVSKGISLITERLSMLEGGKQQILIEDLKNITPYTSGTRVTIKLSPMAYIL
jgi:ligand-binding sensor domain-containing protein